MNPSQWLPVDELHLMSGVMARPDLAIAVQDILQDHVLTDPRGHHFLGHLTLHARAGPEVIAAFQAYLAKQLETSDVSRSFCPFESLAFDVFRGPIPKPGTTLCLALQIRIAGLERQMRAISARAKSFQAYQYPHLNEFGKLYGESHERAYNRWRAHIPYDWYLESEWWQTIRVQALERAERRCQVCNASGPILDVHHRTYDRLGREEDADLTVLCRGCHQLFHGKGDVPTLANGLAPALDKS